MLATALPHEFERAAAAGTESPNVSQLITTDCVCHDTMRSAAPSIVLFQTSDREKLIKFHPELVQRSIRRDLKRPLQGHGRVILEQTAESARSHTNIFRQCETSAVTMAILVAKDLDYVSKGRCRKSSRLSISCRNALSLCGREWGLSQPLRSSPLRVLRWCFLSISGSSCSILTLKIKSDDFEPLSFILGGI